MRRLLQHQHSSAGADSTHSSARRKSPSPAAAHRALARPGRAIEPDHLARAHQALRRAGLRDGWHRQAGGQQAGELARRGASRADVSAASCSSARQPPSPQPPRAPATNLNTQTHVLVLFLDLLPAALEDDLRLQAEPLLGDVQRARGHGRHGGGIGRRGGRRHRLRGRRGSLQRGPYSALEGWSSLGGSGRLLRARDGPLAGARPPAAAATSRRKRATASGGASAPALVNLP